MKEKPSKFNETVNKFLREDESAIIYLDEAIHEGRKPLSKVAIKKVMKARNLGEIALTYKETVDLYVQCLDSLARYEAKNERKTSL